MPQRKEIPAPTEHGAHSSRDGALFKGKEKGKEQNRCKHEKAKDYEVRGP